MAHENKSKDIQRKHVQNSKTAPVCANKKEKINQLSIEN
jgi:hypothetical protein